MLNLHWGSPYVSTIESYPPKHLKRKAELISILIEAYFSFEGIKDLDQQIKFRTIANQAYAIRRRNLWPLLQESL